MWQLYALVAYDLIEDRRRAAASRRRQSPPKPRRSAAGLVRRIINGRGED